MIYLALIILTSACLILSILLFLERTQKSDTESSRYNEAIFFAATAIAASIATFFIINGLEIKLSSDAGVIGDFFGGVLNPTLSLIAITLLIKISKTQTIEFRKSIDTLTAQNNIYKIEKFENTLTIIINKLEKQSDRFLTKTITTPNGKKTQSRAKLLRDRLEKLQSSIAQQGNVSELTICKRAISEIKKERSSHPDQTTAFLSTVKLALELIEKQDIPNKEKKFYYRLFNSSLESRAKYLVCMLALASKRPELRRLLKISATGKGIKEDLYISKVIREHYK